MDVRRLRSGELGTAAGAIGLAVVLFADWFGGQSGWSTLTVGRFLLVLTILLALTLVIVTVRAGNVSMALSAAVVTVGIGALALLYLLYRVGIDEPGRNASVSIDAGAYLGLLCLLGMLGGAWRTMSCGGVRVMSLSWKRIVPLRAGVSPEIERSVVDLPAPLEPISVTISPSLTVSEMPFSASIEP